MEGSLAPFISDIDVKNLSFVIFVYLNDISQSFNLFFSKGYVYWSSLNLIDKINIYSQRNAKF